MTTPQENTYPDKTSKVNMGREVGKKPTSSDPDKAIIDAENKEKERIRENNASSLV